MLSINSNGAIDPHGYVTLKGRQVTTALLIFVSQMIEIERSQLLLHAGNSFSIRDIFHPVLWRTLTLPERRSAGLCLSWLVDHGHVPLVKLRARRGNTLLYQLKFAH